MKLSMPSTRMGQKSAPQPPGVKAMPKARPPKLARGARKRTKPNLTGKGANMDSAHVPYVMDGYRGV